MNAIVRRDVSIVSAIPGTTRDIIEAALDLDGFPVTVLDTAGLRAVEDPIEAEGVTKNAGESAKCRSRVMVIRERKRFAA